MSSTFKCILCEKQITIVDEELYLPALDGWETCLYIIADDFDFDNPNHNAAGSGKWAEIIACDTCSAKLRPAIIKHEETLNVRVSDLKRLTGTTLFIPVLSTGKKEE